ncbi:hypothetical protein Clacol_006934 [Clathrus columnatus]|uniref:ER-bound oxygenase mpaB/mpaB'/Rubber oxygenase catalytic domain-containing protein n=1 Tax=Clathrus columnatus TaxID=1419009 RepID=A0AAV5AEL1_9AGAM|nr:hypothetical protein Clacol_006934 [Clathrus columnatus]
MLGVPDVKFSLTLLLLYMGYVRYRRFQRLKNIQNQYSRIWKEGKLEPEQAQEIIQNYLFYEHPIIIQLGTQSALIKVYALPSFARLLVRTGQLKSPDSISKRVADTATLIATWLSCPLIRPGTSSDPDSDPRGAIAVARVNYLHRKYKISNDDFLYNLGLFIQEPLDWVARYDWRRPDDLERDATFIFWKEIGMRMGIQNIWGDRKEMVEWIKEYENLHLVPSSDSEILANTTISFFLRRFPAVLGIRPFFRNIALTLLADRHRTTMGLPDPPRIFRIAIPLILKFRGPGLIGAVVDALFPESQGLRRLWEKTLVRLNLANPDKFPGPKWKSQGYRLEELGPIEFENQGHEEVLEMAAKLQGCPIKGQWGI